LSGEPIGTVERDPDGATRDIGRRRVVRSTAVGDLLAFAGTFGLVLLYALRGGSYDIVVFEEYGLVIWWLLAIGVAVGILPRVRPARLVLLLCGAMLAYAAWTALSLISITSASCSCSVSSLVAITGVPVPRASDLERSSSASSPS
jgi:hypothetical protein